MNDALREVLLSNAYRVEMRGIVCPSLLGSNPPSVSSPEYKSVAVFPDLTATVVNWWFGTDVGRPRLNLVHNLTASVASELKLFEVHPTWNLHVAVTLLTQDKTPAILHEFWGRPAIVNVGSLLTASAQVKLSMPCAALLLCQPCHEL